MGEVEGRVLDWLRARHGALRERADLAGLRAQIAPDAAPADPE